MCSFRFFSYMLYCRLNKLALNSPCQCTSKPISFVVDIPDPVDSGWLAFACCQTRFGSVWMTANFCLLDLYLDLYITWPSCMWTPQNGSMCVLLKPWWKRAKVRRGEASRTVSTHLEQSFNKLGSTRDLSVFGVNRSVESWICIVPS